MWDSEYDTLYISLRSGQRRSRRCTSWFFESYDRVRINAKHWSSIWWDFKLKKRRKGRSPLENVVKPTEKPWDKTSLESNARYLYRKSENVTETNAILADIEFPLASNHGMESQREELLFTDTDHNWCSTVHPCQRNIEWKWQTE